MNVTTIVKLNGEQIEVSGLFRDGDFVGMPKMTYKGIDIEPLLADLLVGSVFPAREKADEYVYNTACAQVAEAFKDQKHEQ